jgi:hypothetical protein
LNDRDLILAAAQLARRAPEEWNKFMNTFADYTEDKIVDCVQAPLDMLPVAQGRAQALVKLGQIMGDCVKLADNIANKVPPSAKRS